jgi:hypothetical protein
MTEDGGDDSVYACSDMVASSVENYSSTQRSVTDGRGTGVESRELAAGCGRELGSGSGLGWDGDVMEGQDAAEDATFRDSDRGHD